MANYTTADIKALREATGAGMLDVKKALDEADGDQQKALEIIRVKGLKGIAKREGRSTSDGLVTVDIRDGDSGQIGIMVEVNSETDFVAKNQKFTDFADAVLAAAVASGATTLDELMAASSNGTTVQALAEDLAATLGEKIVVRRIAKVEGEKVVSYLHRTNKDLPPQVGVLVAVNAAGKPVARDIAMHLAAYPADYLSRDDVPADIVENERRIAEETARNEGKPEAALPKIIEGRLGGFFKENVLVDQSFAKDPKTTVGNVLDSVSGTVAEFARFRVGS